MKFQTQRQIRETNRKRRGPEFEDEFALTADELEIVMVGGNEACPVRRCGPCDQDAETQECCALRAQGYR